MNIEIDIDGLHCDGKLVMVWADASDLVARDKLIAEFDVPENYRTEERNELNELISDLEDQVWDLENEREELKDTIDGLESDNDYLEEKIEKLKAKLKGNCDAKRCDF